MDIYKKAVRKNLTFQTSVGVVTVNQLFSLSLHQLETAIKTSKKKLTDAGEVGDLDFLVTRKKSSSEEELRFEILKDVYITLRDEAVRKARLSENKREKEKLISILAQKQDEELLKKTPQEIAEMLKSFDEEESED